jgi:hypothetical protein
MVVKYCDICGVKENIAHLSQAHNPITALNYYGIEMDVCSNCHLVIAKAFKNIVNSILDKVKAEVKKIRDID